MRSSRPRKRDNASVRSAPVTGSHGAPIKWCPPASAEGALTHTDWARMGWHTFTLPARFASPRS